jgi:hypothetical protein
MEPESKFGLFEALEIAQNKTYTEDQKDDLIESLANHLQFLKTFADGTILHEKMKAQLEENNPTP